MRCAELCCGYPSKLLDLKRIRAWMEARSFSYGTAGRGGRVCADGGSVLSEFRGNRQHHICMHGLIAATEATCMGMEGHAHAQRMEDGGNVAPWALSWHGVHVG